MRILRSIWRAGSRLNQIFLAHYRTSQSFGRSGLYTLKYACTAGTRHVLRRTALMRRSGTIAKVVANTELNLGTSIPQIAVKISGGVGDYVVIARFLRDLVSAVEPFEFDLYCASPRNADWVFRSVPGFREAYSEFLFDELADNYWLALRVSQFVSLDRERAKWYLLRKYRRLTAVFSNLIRFRPEIDVFIEHHPYMDGFLGQKAVFMGFSRENFLHGMAKVNYGGPRLDLCSDLSVVDKFDLGRQSYVTINNGFDPGFFVTGTRATKCYPHCDELVRIFKSRFPGVMVVQLGTDTSIPIPGVDINLVAKTSMQQAAALLSHSRLHIDNEGGLVHIAQCLGTTSCVIFGPTSLDYFAYPSNINIRPHFCGGCWWTNLTWMDACPRGFDTARCMSTQDPEAIVAAIVAADLRSLQSAFGAKQQAHLHPNGYDLKGAG